MPTTGVDLELGAFAVNRGCLIGGTDGHSKAGAHVKASNSEDRTRRAIDGAFPADTATDDGLETA
jgi:hypothetical protein